MSDLPDELWRRILEIGVQTCGFTYKDLCCLSISSRRLHRLSDDDELWSVLLSSNFCLIDRSASPSLASKSLYKFRFEREKEKKIAAHRRAVLRKESQIAEHSRKIREFENSLAVESDKMRATLVELSNLRKIRQASVALNVWQPEVVRGKIKQVVEQNAVPVESRVHALEMELKLCKQQISGFEKAYDEKRRFDVAKEELKSMRYHPLRPNESMSSVKDVCETNIRAKKMKRCSKGCQSPCSLGLLLRLRAVIYLVIYIASNPLGNLLLLPLPSLADISSAKEAFRRRKSQSALPVKICRRTL
ncbi:F-box protein SKIP24 isoform X2 [Morus notabilis]|uniref:F-box protein SKIP24 isoform X2 n=1 Tax=Morus notabilis TaxID=981085 RepID=UPI000CED2108|nr:F-box protein SKIP24 isoform X2 [Morus notabilis]